MFGDGKYPVQPIYADDVANICIDQGQLSEDTVVDAAGPDTFEYREFLQILSEGMGCRNILIPIPDWLTLMVGQFMGLLLQDIVIT
jgi:NADH dehydrogenase